MIINSRSYSHPHRRAPPYPVSSQSSARNPQEIRRHTDQQRPSPPPPVPSINTTTLPDPHPPPATTAMATPLISTLLLALSLYAASLSFLAITRLQSWEALSEKAAKVSSTAANQLQRTRTTQGAAAGAVSRAFTSSDAFLSGFFCSKLHPPVPHPTFFLTTFPNHRSSSPPPLPSTTYSSAPPPYRLRCSPLWSPRLRGTTSVPSGRARGASRGRRNGTRRWMRPGH